MMLYYVSFFLLVFLGVSFLLYDIIHKMFFDDYEDRFYTIDYPDYKKYKWL